MKVVEEIFEHRIRQQIEVDDMQFGLMKGTVNAFKSCLDNFWKHQSVKFDFTADLTGTGNRSEEVKK